jgi:LuxR family maltose regulon positive regulatory protein
MAASPAPARARVPLRRTHLLKALARPWKVAALCAPAGFGKTTLAAQYARGRDTLWCRLSPEDRVPGHLLESLLLAAERARHPFGVRTRRLFESRRDMERDGALLTARFLDELRERGRRRLVVLDEVHALDEARAALQWLRRVIEESGPAVHFLLAGRGECPLPLARLDLEGGSLVLRAADLRFTRQELERLVPAAVRGGQGGMTDPLLATLAGWPAGVVLAARHLERRRRAPLPDARLRAAHGEPSEQRLAAALDYLAEEVFAPLPESLRASLCRAALLDELDAGALRAVLGEAGAAFAREVERRDLFVERLPDGGAPRFHPLFRSFLRARWEASVPALGRRGLSERLARHWMGRGQAARAIRTLAEAGLIEEAVRLFDRAAALRPRARVDALGPVALEITRGAGASSALPPGLLLLGAYQARDARRDPEATRLAREAQAGFLRERGAMAAARAFGLETEVALKGGRMREARLEAGRLLRRIPRRERAARGVLARHLGSLELHMGEPARARATLAWAARELAGSGNEIEQAEIALGRATVAYTEGHWDVYLRLARRALAVFRRAGYLERAGTTLINMGEACTYLGLEEVALAHFDEAAGFLPRRGGEEDPYLLIYRARALSEQGELAEAARRFACARVPVARTGHPTQPAELDVWEGICARRRGSLRAAEGALGRAEAAFAAMDSPSWQTLVRMEFALVRGLAGRDVEALRELARTARVTRRLGDRKELARNALFEARVRLASGTPWRAPLARALRALVQLDYLVLLRKEADVAVPLLAAALGDRALSGLARRCVAALPDPLPARIAAAASGTSPAGGMRAGVRRPAAYAPHSSRPGGQPAARASGGAIEIRMLGGFEVVRDGAPVRFPRSAAAALVACLALRRGAVRRETLAEALWPGLAARASRNRFDVALNAARRALEPSVPARGPFQVLTSEGGLCRLAGSGITTDVGVYDRLARDCEGFLERRARARWSGGGGPDAREARRALAPLEQALAAYRGELLPEFPDAVWAEAERERLRDRHHRLLVGLAAIALSLAEPARTIEAARRVLAEDPLHEEALRLVMRALAAEGERAAALRLYRDFERRLAAELDTEPGPETAALGRELASA